MSTTSQRAASQHIASDCTHRANVILASITSPISFARSRIRCAHIARPFGYRVAPCDCIAVARNMHIQRRLDRPTTSKYLFTIVWIGLVVFVSTSTVPRAVDPECSNSVAAQPPASSKILIVDLDNPCAPYLEAFFNQQLSALFTSWGFTASYLRLTPSTTWLSNLAQYSQIWIIDFSADPDNYQSAWTSISSWFSARQYGEIITDSRFAASVMIGTPCFPARNRLPNTNLFQNYAVRSCANVREHVGAYFA